MKRMAPFVCRSGKTTTGRIGISLRHSKRKLGGKVVVKRFFVVRLGSNPAKSFSLDSLGKAEAWREAVRCRERYERAVSAKRATLPTRHELQRGYLRKWKARQTRPLNDPVYRAAYYQKNKEAAKAYNRTNSARDNTRRRKLTKQEGRAK